MKWWAIWRVYQSPGKFGLELTEADGPIVYAGNGRSPVMTFQRETRDDAERVLGAVLEHGTVAP